MPGDLGFPPEALDDLCRADFAGLDSLWSDAEPDGGLPPHLLASSSGLGPPPPDAAAVPPPAFRCLQQGHPPGCEECIPPPMAGEEELWELVGDLARAPSQIAR